MEALRKKLEDAQRDLEAARNNSDLSNAIPPVRYGAEYNLRRAEERLAEAQKAYDATHESQTQEIERLRKELAKAQDALSKASPSSKTYPELEKAVAIAEYKLAQASKPAAAAAALWGGKSRRKRRRGRETRRSTAARRSRYSKSSARSRGPRLQNTVRG